MSSKLDLMFSMSSSKSKILGCSLVSPILINKIINAGFRQHAWNIEVECICSTCYAWFMLTMIGFYVTCFVNVCIVQISRKQVTSLKHAGWTHPARFLSFPCPTSSQGSNSCYISPHIDWPAYFLQITLSYTFLYPFHFHSLHLWPWDIFTRSLFTLDQLLLQLGSASHSLFF